MSLQEERGRVTAGRKRESHCRKKEGEGESLQEERGRVTAGRKRESDYLSDYTHLQFCKFSTEQSPRQAFLHPSSRRSCSVLNSVHMINPAIKIRKTTCRKGLIFKRFVNLYLTPSQSCG